MWPLRGRLRGRRAPRKRTGESYPENVTGGGRVQNGRNGSCVRARRWSGPRGGNRQGRRQQGHQRHRVLHRGRAGIFRGTEAEGGIDIVRLGTADDCAAGSGANRCRSRRIICRPLQRGLPRNHREDRRGQGIHPAGLRLHAADRPQGPRRFRQGKIVRRSERSETRRRRSGLGHQRQAQSGADEGRPAAKGRG